MSLNQNQGKFLLVWLENLTGQRLFFAAWVGAGLVFLVLFIRQLQKQGRRQFRETHGRSPSLRQTAPPSRVTTITTTQKTTQLTERKPD